MCSDQVPPAESSLSALRGQTPQPGPARFVGWNPGCWVQYYDDTPAKDHTKALSAPALDPAVLARKQRERCAACFSLQAFEGARTKGRLLSFRNLGVDVDLVPGAERPGMSVGETDRRKEAYLRGLRGFPLRPHWLTETTHGFHVVFRVMPVRDPARVRAAEALNRRLVSALGGDTNAALLTQCLRIPGTYQFKDLARPFLCRLLLDHAGALPPYDLERVRAVLDAWEVFHGVPTAESGKPSEGSAPKRGWRGALAGVPQGMRNATAASVARALLVRLPVELWETGGWGGLKEWNGRNADPLPEPELRRVYESIARRERRSDHARRFTPRPDVSP